MTMPKGWKSISKPNDLFNTKDKKMSSDVEEKELRKWFIERIEYEIHAYINNLKSNKEKFNSFVNEWKCQNIFIRNSLLSLISLFIVTLIGLASVMPFLIMILIPTIFIAIIISLMFFTIFTFWKRKGIKLLNSIDISIIQPIERLNYIDGFVAAGSFDIDILEAKQLYAIGQFVKIVGANHIESSIMYKKASKSILFIGSKQFLIENLYQHLIYTKTAYDILDIRRESIKEDILKPHYHLLASLTENQNKFLSLYQEMEEKLKS